MALRSIELAQIVWAETKSFGLGKADGSGDVNSIRRMVAQLAASTNGDGFDKRESLPPTNDKIYRDSVLGLQSICDGAQNAGPPQSRLIFWEAGNKTDRPNPQTSPPPPWNTMQAAGINYVGRFQISDSGRLIDVFGRGPVDGADDGPIMVNALTGTGLPDGQSIVARASAPQARPRLGASLFFLALAIFIVAALWSFGNGLASRLTLNEFVRTANIVAAPANPAPAAAPQATSPAPASAAPPISAPPISCDPAPPSNPLEFSLGPADWRPKSPSSNGCDELYGNAQKKVASALHSENGWLEWYAAKSLSWAGAGGWTVSLVLPLGLALIAFVLLFVASGYGVVGLAWGTIIDRRNRLSLTLAQLALWSIVILAGWLVLGLYNFGFAGTQFAALDQAAAATNAPTLIKAVKDFVLFPAAPYSLMGIIGLAGFTPLISRSIANSGVLGSGAGASQSQSPSPQQPGSTASAPTYLDTNESPADAQLADMVVSEVEGSQNHIDTSRIQNAGITGILVIAYAMLLFDAVSAIDPVRVALAAVKSTSVFTSMPAIDGTFVALLAVSHAALLGSKVNDKRQNS